MDGWFQTFVNKAATAQLGRFAAEEINFELRMYPCKLFSLLRR